MERDDAEMAPLLGAGGDDAPEPPKISSRGY